MAAVYGGERMPVHLYLPKNVKPPYQPVLFFPGALAIGAANSANLQLNTFENDFIVMSGRALVYPVYKFHLRAERPTGHVSTARADASLHHLGAAARERCPAGARLCRNEAGHRRRPADLLRFVVGRTARADHHRARPAHQGGCPAHGRSASSGKSAPEVDPFNFAPRVRTPILMLNGDQDFIFPLQTSQRPLFHGLGTSSADKKHVLYPGGHVLFVRARRAQCVEQGLLRGLQRKDEVLIAVQHESGNSHARRKVERIDFGRRLAAQRPPMSRTPALMRGSSAMVIGPSCAPHDKP